MRIETTDSNASLVTALNSAAGANTWAYVPSSTELPPASEQDVITNAMIYKPASVMRRSVSPWLSTRRASPRDSRRPAPWFTE